MTSRRIAVLVTKDSGGAMTAPKLTAAALEGVLVVVVQRPRAATGSTDEPLEVGSVDRAADWVLRACNLLVAIAGWFGSTGRQPPRRA